MKLQIIFGGISEEIEVDAELNKVERHQLVMALLEHVEAEVDFIRCEREENENSATHWGV